MLIVIVVILFLVCVGSTIWFFTTDSDAVEICMLFSITLSLIFAIGLTGVGCSEGWTEEGRKEHIAELRTELINKIQKADDPYMLGKLADEVYKFNEEHEDDAIDFSMYVRDKY
jgi:hypothetical protein